MVKIVNHNVIRSNENDTSKNEVSFFLIKGAYNEINNIIPMKEVLIDESLSHSSLRTNLSTGHYGWINWFWPWTRRLNRPWYYAGTTMRPAAVICTSPINSVVPYTRALQTALEIMRFNDIPLKVELGLHEWLPDNTGSRTDTDEQAATAYKLYRQHAGKRTTASPLPYESAAEMKARVLATLNKYAASYDCIACVMHGEVMRQFGDQKDGDSCGVRVIAVD